MNWKEQPQLFTNGNFYLWDGKTKYRIQGINDTWGVGFMFICDHSLEIHATKKHCTLIARKIEDMSDEEIAHYKSLLRVPRYNALETPESFLYLLTIGILPKQFKTDDVIFTNERNMENGS